MSPYRMCRNTDNGNSGFVKRINYNSISPNPNIISNSNRPYYLCPHTNVYIIANDWKPVLLKVSTIADTIVSVQLAISSNYRPIVNNDITIMMY